VSPTNPEAHEPAPPERLALDRDEIHARTDRTIAAAILAKPLATSSESRPDDLVPLFLFALPDPSGSANTAAALNGGSTVSATDPATMIEFGRPSGPGAAHDVEIAPRPVVFRRRTRVELRGRSHERLDFRWFVRGKDAERIAANWTLREVRMTLDGSGLPLLWELPYDRRHAFLIHVASRVEKRAAAVFGAALPGRRYSVEKSLDESPDTIVARVLEDGPVPMGPWVYSDESFDVLTLLCRCMMSQVDGELFPIEYAIVDEAEAFEVEEGPGVRAGGHDELIERSRGPGWIESVLRLPDL
jgi:hypothetical protein